MKKRLTALCLLAASSALANPQLIAHRGGTGDAPENTLPAIKLALENHAEAIWVTVQLSRDGVPVLYRSSDLSALTNAEGKVSSLTAAELAKVDAGWKWGDDSHPWRGKQATIPTLQSVLQQWPHTFFYIDIKSPDADPAVMGERLLAVLKATDSLDRVRVYSTDDRYIAALPSAIPRFVTRSETRTKLATISLSHQCQLSSQHEGEQWYGLELKRKVEVVEKFTLGEGISPATLTWDKEAMDCFRSQGKAHIIFFGINSAEDYRTAKERGCRRGDGGFSGTGEKLAVRESTAKKAAKAASHCWHAIAGWRLAPYPAYKTEAADPASAAPPGTEPLYAGWRLRLTRPTKLKQQVRHAQRRRALQNTPLLTLRLASETFLTRVTRFRTVADFLQPQRRDPAAAALNALALHQVAQRHAEDHQRKNHKGRDKYRQHRQPPKSSSMMFSSSTPMSLSIFITAAFITGGPHI
ncbi:Glycerophosphoryl diester phosphodiesterase family protein (modular protein) [Klebsiella variicola]|nr:Glycerophosphoryl diester phosphodiesterase family protein (modular protein) [Klebsiella variicola]